MFSTTHIDVLSRRRSEHIGQGRFDEMTYDKTKTVFRLNAPSLPKVRIYKNGQGGRPVKTVKMRRRNASAQQRLSERRRKLLQSVKK